MPPQMAATLPPDVPTIGEDTFEERRDAIDLVATLRARALRVALFGTLIHRPPLDPGNTSETTDDRLAALEEQVDSMVKVRAMMAGDGNYDRFAPSLCVWLVDQAQAEPDATMNISKMISLSQEILALAQTEPGKMAPKLAEQFKFGRFDFFDAVTRFCNRLWANLDTQRNLDAQEARQATQAVGEILGRLEYIGKHVRLVSLNASVEAARAGDAGLGLAVIATEFKTLAEEIQSLATRARTQIDTI